VSDVTSFLALEPLLLARLQELLPAKLRVLTAEDLAGIEEAQLPDRSVHVVYNGVRVIGGNASGSQAETEQSWLVVVCVKHSGTAAKASAEAKARVAPLVNTCLRALMGWRPIGGPGTPGLKLATPPKPASRPPYYYFPLAFSAMVPVVRDQLTQET
jgi:hypothetical protein